MPVPKRRQSKSRRDLRRTQDALAVPTWTTCGQCGEACRPHHICEKCGFYKGKKIVESKKV
ncbi:MAG: 50S ribosomal protein L32 [Candidatus Cloacimonetes bacterium]|nr:50S ribosomal protein L32 [Candidatus Cloacimonadota bacterium]